MTKSEQRACVILVAAGTGSRFSGSRSGVPKQFVELGGLALYRWSLKTLSRHPGIGLVVLVTLKDMIPAVQKALVGTTSSAKILVTAGGATRQESVYNGLKSLPLEEDSTTVVLVHDAARPFLTSRMIDATIKGAGQFGACTTAITPADTIKSVEGNKVVATLDRSRLVLVQTPQAARFDWLLAAHEKARVNGISGTDDASILEAAGHHVQIVAGSPYNLKVTGPEDLILAEAMSGILSQKQL